MDRVIVSEGTKQAVNEPFEIVHSPLVLSIYSVIFGTGVLLIGVACLGITQQILRGDTSRKTIGGLGWMVAIELLFLFLCYYRALRPWRDFGKPMIRLCAEGIALRGKPLLRWGDVAANELRSLAGYRGSVFSWTIVRLTTVGGKKLSVFFSDLRISEDDYFRLCELYEGASERRLEVPNPA